MINENLKTGGEKRKNLSEIEFKIIG